MRDEWVCKRICAQVAAIRVQVADSLFVKNKYLYANLFKTRFRGVCAGF